MRLSGFRPSPIAIAGLIGLLWTVSSRALRDFIWADLCEGMLDLRTLPRNSRRLARAGLVVLGVVIAALLFNDFWRANSPLIALTGSRIFRGQLVPIGLLPMTLFLLVVAWSFVLAGALHSHWVLRVVFLLLYELNAIGWLNSVFAGEDRMTIWLGGGATAGVALVFTLRWRAPARPVLEFAAIFALVSVIFLLAQRRELQTQQLFGIPTGLAKISFNVQFLGGLITPLLLLIGMNIADFTRRASHWTGDILTARAPRLAALVTLALLFAWRWFFAITETIEHAGKVSTQEQFNGLLGALGDVAVVALIWWLTGRLHRDTPDEETMASEVEPWTRPLVLTYTAVQLVTFFIVALLMAVAVGRWAEPVQIALFGLVDQLTDKITDPWHLLFSAGALALSLWLARKGRRGLSLYLGILGALHLWWNATTRGNVLGALHGVTNQDVELWWMVVFSAAAMWWIMRRELTAERVTRLVVLLLILTLMRQRDFIENPFSPFFGFAGIFFIAFSLVWDISTSGSWTNVESPNLPRISRVFLYLGSILLTATVLNWSVTIHDLDTVEKFTGGAALVGFDRFGKPLLYATFAIALATHVRPANAGDDRD
ncbi:MAG TPA: hypothetical protein VK993_12960 [Chthoniobacterales bacterium]|nr:hypothetical protein [Chthoniobacterales bacterium]